MSAGRSVNSQSQAWGTPKKYVKAVKKFFGGSIALDPCSNEFSFVHAQTEYMLPENDGLSESWDFPTIYVNPPYGADRVFGRAKAICFLYDTRLKFLENGLDIGKGAPMSCSMIYWGERFDEFYKEFINFGAVVDLTNLKGEAIGKDDSSPRTWK